MNNFHLISFTLVWQRNKFSGFILEVGRTHYYKPLYFQKRSLRSSIFIIIINFSKLHTKNYSQYIHNIFKKYKNKLKIHKPNPEQTALHRRRYHQTHLALKALIHFLDSVTKILDLNVA